ncbi:MAG TPA: hypothetical protein DDX71_08315 [Ruminococcus sp.]|nr:hypothetical protein [Ruminococcus sp.]
MPRRNPDKQSAGAHRGFSLFPHKKARVVSAVMLTQRVRCFKPPLMFRLPPDMRLFRRGKDSLFFFGKKSGMMMYAMQLPFSRNVRRLTAIDLSIAFRQLIPVQVTPEIRYGFLRRSPTMTAVWTETGGKKTVLHLIQVQKTVYLLQFYCPMPQSDAAAEAVIATTELVR